MKYKLFLIPLTLGFLILLGFILPTYYVNLSSQVLIAILLASSLNILVGISGLDSFCHAALAGVCSYAIIYLYSVMGMGHLASISGAFIIGILVSALFGLISLRATGLSFLMITAALNLVTWGLAYRWVDVTGGDHGLGGLTRPNVVGMDFSNPHIFYFLVLAVTGLVILFIYRWIYSPVGITLRGAKDQSRRMSAFGYNVWLVRWIAFVISGSLASIAGILFAYYHQFISPESLSIISSAEIYLMVLVGGVGTFIGPMVGAVLVTLTQLWISSYVERWVMLLGIMYIFVVLMMPQGIAPAFNQLVNRNRLQGGR